MTPALETRDLARDEIDLIWTINRSEVHHHIFQVREGRLTRVPAFFEIPGWHPKTIETDTIKLRDCFDRGGFSAAPSMVMRSSACRSSTRS